MVVAQLADRSRGPWFESSQRQYFIENLFTVNCIEKTKNFCLSNLQPINKESSYFMRKIIVKIWLQLQIRNFLIRNVLCKRHLSDFAFDAPENFENVWGPFLSINEKASHEVKCRGGRHTSPITLAVLSNTYVGKQYL